MQIEINHSKLVECVANVQNGHIHGWVHCCHGNHWLLLHKSAHEGYHSYLQAYASHSIRNVFNVEQLVLQHVACSFSFLLLPLLCWVSISKRAEIVMACWVLDMVEMLSSWQWSSSLPHVIAQLLWVHWLFSNGLCECLKCDSFPIGALIGPKIC